MRQWFYIRTKGQAGHLTFHPRPLFLTATLGCLKLNFKNSIIRYNNINMSYCIFLTVIKTKNTVYMLACFIADK